MWGKCILFNAFFWMTCICCVIFDYYAIGTFFTYVRNGDIFTHLFLALAENKVTLLHN